MMYVIATGGKQYLVKSGQTIRVEKLIGNPGETIIFDKVLLVADDTGGAAKVGQPYVPGSTVAGVIAQQGKTRTLRVEKFKRKVRYHKVHGQRQRFTEVTIQ